MILNVTPAQLTETAREIYSPSDYRHAPTQIFIDHYHGHPATTFLRAAFPNRFTVAAAAKLELLRDLLLEKFGAADVVLCVYYQPLDRDEMVRHSIDIADR